MPSKLVKFRPKNPSKLVNFDCKNPLKLVNSVLVRLKMQRIQEKDLLEWYNDSLRKPLIVWGARQVGKTYLVLELFAKKYFDDFVYIDLKKDKDSCEYFNSTCNPDDYLLYIETRFGKKVSEKVPLIFDEVQTCLNVLTALKYFCQDYRSIPVIATGSMVRLSLRDYSGKKADDFLFPVGKVNSVKVFPMTFEEYLMNCNGALLKEIKKAFNEKRPMKEAFHNLAMDTLHEYLVIGGMPEVVNTFIVKKSFVDAKKVLKDIYENYLGDMSSFNVSNETILKTKAVFNSIFKQLNKENKNFKISQIEKGKSNRDYLNAYQWLELAGLIYRSKNVSGKLSLPITEESSGLFRLYLADVGLFTFQSEVPSVDFYVKDKRNTLSGVFYENYVATELAAKGVPLYYWTGKASHEFEFVMLIDNTICALDVKKSRGGTESLKEFRNFNGNAKFVKISSNNFGFDEENNCMTIPHYAAFLLPQLNKPE